MTELRMTKEEAKKYIDITVVPNRYFDKNGKEVKAGDYIRYDGESRTRKVYLLEGDEQLGIDATNPSWIRKGRASECEYGCYPLLLADMIQVEVVENGEELWIGLSEE